MRLILIFCALFSANVFAQQCNQNMKQTNPTVEFIDNNDGTVTDVINMTIWKKCLEGQSFIEGVCYGEPTVYENFELAMNLSDEEYRLPNIKELVSIVEYSCFEPAINLEVFPDTPIGLYWSSTPNVRAESDKPNGKLIDFTDGTDIIKDISLPRYVRLIKN